MDLTCPKSQRLLIFSAVFGTSLQAPHECSILSASRSNNDASTSNDLIKKGTIAVCQAPKANELVMNRCQGQKQCRLSASFDEFGWTDCARSVPNINHNAHLHLKVVYNCAPKEILRDSLVAGRPMRTNTTDAHGGSIRAPSPAKPPKSIEAQINVLPSNAFKPNSSLDGALDSTTTTTTISSGSSNASTTTHDYSGFVDAPRYDPNDSNANKKRAQPETAANYKTHSLDHPLTDEVKQEGERASGDWLNLYRYLESKCLADDEK